MGTNRSNDNRRVLEPGAKAALEKMRNEIASELSLPVPNGEYWGGVPSRECGHIGGLIGGRMVRDMIRMAEEQLKNKK